MSASSLKKSGKRMINKKGNSITIVHKYDCVYEPSLGEHVCSETRYPLKATVSNFTSQELQSDFVSIDDLKALVETDVNIKKTEEDEGYTVEYLGKEWKIINIRIITSEDLLIVQQLQIRGVV